MNKIVSTTKDQDIAIIGMAGIFPGAGDLEKFWQNIMNQADVIREVGDDRWRVDEMFDPDPRSRDKTYSKWGGFLENIPFDPTRYGIPPVSLKVVEAVQLLALEITRLALEDTGIGQADFPWKKTAVIFGAGGMHDQCVDYIARTMLSHYLPRVEGLPQETKAYVSEALRSLLPEWTGDSFPGILGNVISGRVANRFDMMGSNYTVDAACASSLAALDVGMAKLRSGQADAAIVGAVDMTDNVVGFTAFSKTFVLSPRGKSCPFDDSADGIVISEGAAALVLKRLADAEKDGDRIHAVIKGIGSSSDGRNRSLTAPHPQGQVMALDRAYQDAGVDPGTVGLIEAHGTGTVVGDKSEVEALDLVFGKASDGNGQNGFRCALGSVKSNIGHTKIAAGLAGLIKGVLALEHQILPPTMGVSKPNSRINFKESPFYLNMEPRPWFAPRHAGPRRCGVSAFGFGGTNFHVVVEEGAGRYNRHVPLPLREGQIFIFTAPDRQGLADRVNALLSRMKHPLYTDITDMARALYLEERTRADSVSNCRLYVVAGAGDELTEKLGRVSAVLGAGGAPVNGDGVYYSEQPGLSGRVCFLFPGQGSQRVNMLRDLLTAFPQIRSPFEEGDALLTGWLDGPLSGIVYPEPVFCEKERSLQSDRVNDTQTAQPALAAAGLAAMTLLGCFGIHPDFTAGHSFGEYLALHAAGVISRSDLFRLAAVRGKLSREAGLANDGKMAAVHADADTVNAFLEETGATVRAANFNSPRQVVIGGPEKDIEKCLVLAKEKGLKARRIPVTAAFHTAAMRSAADRLALELDKVDFFSPKLPVYSNTTGEPYPNDPGAIRTLLSRHIQEPLDFVTEIRRLYENGAFVFIEAGPGKVLSGFVDRILDGSPHITLTLDYPGRSGTGQLAHLLAEAGAAGLPVDLSSWFGPAESKVSDLETVFANAARSADPSPMTWRISNGKIMPWHSKPGALPVNESPSAVSRRKGVKPAEGKKIGNDSNKNNANRVAIQNPRKRTGQEENRMMNEKDNSEGFPVSPQGSPSLISRIQANLDQFIELQRDQQRLMDRFLDMQQQLMTSVLNGNGAALKNVGIAPVEKADDEGVKSKGRPVAPPAPVLPRLKTVGAPPVPSMSALMPVPPVHGEPVSPVVQGQPAATAQFQTDLLRIVSEQTGYPEDMLNLDAHLEADLGIDSIKRVEIFSLLGDHHQLLESQSEEMVLEELADLKSLRKIIDWYDANRLRLLEGEEQRPKKS